MSLDNITIGKKIGYGMIGTVYLASDENTKYAYKIEHILKSNVNKNYTEESPWRVIDFSKKVCEKYPDQFTVLHDYKFVDVCDHKQQYPFDLKNFAPKQQKLFHKLSESKNCFISLWSLKDTSFSSKIKHISQKQFYSMLIQTLYIIHIMKKHGYVHRDLHSGNIACSQTNKKTIQLLNKSIPTFGYIYSVIDYGLITHKKFDLTIKEKKILSESSDVISIIYLTFENKVWNFVNKLMKRDKKFRIDFVSVFANFKKTTYFDMISKLTNHKELQMLLFELIFPEHHQIILLKEHYPGKYVKPYIKISFDDLLYMISHYDNPKKIADHFLSKLPKL